jgi:hypothetical protein
VFPIPQDIMTEPEEFTSLKGATIPRKISVDYISFSAHVDYSQNSDFIEQVKAQHVVRGCVKSSSFHSLSHFPRKGSRSRRTERHGATTSRNDVTLQGQGRGCQDSHTKKSRDLVPVLSWRASCKGKHIVYEITVTSSLTRNFRRL